MQDTKTQLNPAQENQDHAELVKLLQLASTQEEKDDAVMTWLKRFPGLSKSISKSYFNQGGFIDLIIAEYCSAERCQIFCQLFAGRDEQVAAAFLQVLQNTWSSTEGFRHVSTAELKIFLDLCNPCQSWEIERIVPRLKKVQNTEDFDFGAILVSEDHLAFFKNFMRNIFDHHRKDYFDDASLIEFFRLMQMPIENLRRLWSLREKLSKDYFDYFVLTLLKDINAAEIQDMCSEEQAHEISAAPYLMLFRDPDDTDVYLELLSMLDPADDTEETDCNEDARVKAFLHHFVQSMQENQLLTKHYAVSPYTTNFFHSESNYLTDFPWGDIVTLTEMCKRVRNGTDLCSATIKLIATSEGAVLQAIGPYLSAQDDPEFAMLEMLVFDYPEMCTELEQCPVNEQYLQENFVSFVGYSDIAVAKRVLQHPHLARLHLRNLGQKPCELFNALHREGIYDLLLAQDQTCENLQILTSVPHPDDYYFCPFFLIDTLIYAHKKQFLAGLSLLETMLAADITRFKLLIRCMSMLTRQYTANSDNEKIALAFNKMCDDLIDSGLMESIFILNPSAIIPRAAEIDMSKLIENLMEDLLPTVSHYNAKLQLVALKMMLKGMDAASPYFINIGETEGAVEGFLSFIATQFNLYIVTIKNQFAQIGKLSESKDDRVLKFLLDKPELTQRCFEKQLQEALKEFAVDNITVRGDGLL